MDLIQLILVLVAVGVIMYLVNAYVPMEAKIKQILNAIVIIAIALFLLSLFVEIPRIHVGR